MFSGFQKVMNDYNESNHNGHACNRPTIRKEIKNGNKNLREFIGGCMATVSQIWMVTNGKSCI